MDGTLVKIFDSVKDAKEDTSGCIRALYGQTNSAKGFIWKFIDD